MPPSLEERRLAIAAALRDAMAEPETAVGPAPDVYPRETPIVEFRSIADDTLEWESELAITEDVTDWETPAVPPLELAGSLSRAASLALFGHI